MSATRENVGSDERHDRHRPIPGTPAGTSGSGSSGPGRSSTCSSWSTGRPRRRGASTSAAAPASSPPTCTRTPAPAAPVGDRQLRRHARRGAAPRGRRVSTFELGDIAALDAGARLDVVFSNAALHWVPDHPAAARRGCVPRFGPAVSSRSRCRRTATTRHTRSSPRSRTSRHFARRSTMRPRGPARTARPRRWHPGSTRSCSTKPGPRGASTCDRRPVVVRLTWRRRGTSWEWDERGTGSLTLLRAVSPAPALELFEAFVARYRRRLLDVGGANTSRIFDASLQRILFRGRLPEDAFPGIPV